MSLCAIHHYGLFGIREYLEHSPCFKEPGSFWKDHEWSNHFFWVNDPWHWIPPIAFVFLISTPGLSHRSTQQQHRCADTILFPVCFFRFLLWVLFRAPSQSPSPAELTAAGHSDELTGKYAFGGTGPQTQWTSANLAKGYELFTGTSGSLVYPTLLNPSSSATLIPLLDRFLHTSHLTKTSQSLLPVCPPVFLVSGSLPST